MKKLEKPHRNNIRKPKLLVVEEAVFRTFLKYKETSFELGIKYVASMGLLDTTSLGFCGRSDKFITSRYFVTGWLKLAVITMSATSCVQRSQNGKRKFLKSKLHHNILVRQ